MRWCTAFVAVCGRPHSQTEKHRQGEGKQTSTGNTSVNHVVRTGLPSGEDTGGNPTFLRTATKARRICRTIYVRSPDFSSPGDPHRMRLVDFQFAMLPKRRASPLGSDRLAGPTGLMPNSLAALQGVYGFSEEAARRLVVCCIC
jgi:hypothetical protein